MRKLLIGALVMALPVLMLGQESVEQSLAREAREWEEALKVQRMIDEYLGQMKLDAQSILDDLKAELERKQSDMKWELYMQEEELRLERNRLLRELEDARFERRLIEEFLIYRPRYWREPYYFFIKDFPLPFEWRR